MALFEKTTRFIAIALAVLFIFLSLFGIVGAWFINTKATGAALKGFGLVESGVAIVDAGVGRVGDLIATSRTEVQQASETITTVGPRAQANSAVLNALNERLETNLEPRVAQIQKVLAPVRDALGTVANAVSMLNSLPMMKDRAPRLAKLDEAFDRLEELSGDAKQLHATLRDLTATQKNDVAAETVGILNKLAQRIDSRLAEVQANVQGVRTDIDELQNRLGKRKSQVLFVFNLLALLVTLAMIWILYTQVVVLRHHWRHLRQPAVLP